ncbi:MAG TPA: TolC family protein [Bacteroidales bacterium]|nr:TolC family protein [Bacteroidales bacterium]
MRFLLTFITCFISGYISGQDVLNEYIKYGLENNLALKQKESDYSKSLEALREARGLFYPDISFQARYTLSNGGRVIEFPVGDLLNPVYMTLNQLTSSQMFPMLSNQEILFLRPHEQETKLRLVQPVINTDIYYNSKISRELTIFRESDVNQYRRELRAEISKAYYNVVMAGDVYQMLIETRNLLLENIRVNRKLIENGKATPDYLYRSQAELAGFEQELSNADKNRTVARAYFNFLLNKPLDDTITVWEADVFPSLSAASAEYTKSAIENREELKKLESYVNIARFKESMEKSGKIPDMYLAVDYGIQGTEYRFNRDEDYVQASALLTWNLFKGFSNRSKIRQAEIDREMANRQLEEAAKQIELQVLSTMNELFTAEKGITAAESRLKNATEGFRLVSRKYEEGQATQIEFIDSRTTMTQAGVNLIVSRFNYLSAFAEFEKVAAICKQE